MHLGQGVYQRVNTEDVITAHPVSWGGKRKGAGRKESGNREEKSIARFTVTKKEKEEIKKLLKKLRIPNFREKWKAKKKKLVDKKKNLCYY